MTYDYPHLFHVFAADVGCEEAVKLAAKALILAGVSLEELKHGGHERVRNLIAKRMFALYGPDHGRFFEELSNIERNMQSKS